MRPARILLIAALALASAAPRQPGAEVARAESQARALPADGFRDLDLEAALAAARSEGKPVMVAFYATGCGRCAAYDQITFAREDVAAWLSEHVVAIRRLDDHALAERHEVGKEPQVLFLDVDGLELDRIDGYLDPGPFLADAATILAGNSQVSLARAAVEALPTDPYARLGHASALLERNRRRAALEPLLWVLDHTRGDPAWEDQRLGFVLARLTFLARTQDEARAALVERRDRAEATLLAPGAESLDAASSLPELELCARELVALDGALGELPRTLALWDALHSREGVPASVLATLLDENTQQLLLNAGRYEDLLAGIGDPLVLLQQRLDELIAYQEELQRSGPPGKGDPTLRFRISAIHEDAARWYQALVGAGREVEAGSLAELLLGLQPTARAYLALIGAAKAAGRLDLGRALAEQGLETVPEGQQRQELRRVSRLLLREDD